MADGNPSMTAYEMLNLRWRAVRWLLCVADGDLPGAAAIVRTSDIEGWSLRDFADEIDLLRNQFRNMLYLPAEWNRLWRQLNEGIAA